MDRMTARYITKATVGHGRWHMSVLWCLFALTLLLLLGTIRNGFSFLDEAYYLALIVDPTAFDANLHVFAFPMHVVFLAFGRSIIALRLLGIALLLVTGACAGDALRRYFRPFLPSQSEPPLALLGAFFSLGVYVLWVQTPAYNLLVSASGAVLLTGAFHWLTNDRDGRYRYDWAASVVVGLGGCLVFFAKPPTAMLAAIGVAVLLGLTWYRHGLRRAAERTLLVGAFSLLPVLAILQSTVGIARFITMARLAVSVLQFGNGPLELPLRTLGELYASPAILTITFTGFVFIVAWSRGRAADAPKAPVLERLALAIFVANLLFLAARIAYRAAAHATPWLYVGFPTISTALAWLGYALVQYRGRAASVHIIAPLFVLVAVPLLSAYGSANPLLVLVGEWLYGPLLAAVLAGRLFFRAPIARWVEVTCATYVLFFLVLAAQLPWGLSRPVFRQTDRTIALPFASDTLLVDAGTARYATALRAFAARGHLAKDTPIMDLSGGGPGTALMLNNRAPFYPWILPMFENSGKIADAIWDSLSPDEQRAAWIIAPIDSRFADTRVARYLARHQRNYRLVGKTEMDFAYIYNQGTQPITVWQPIAQSGDGDR